MLYSEISLLLWPSCWDPSEDKLRARDRNDTKLQASYLSPNAKHLQKLIQSTSTKIYSVKIAAGCLSAYKVKGLPSAANKQGLLELQTEDVLADAKHPDEKSSHS